MMRTLLATVLSLTAVAVAQDAAKPAPAAPTAPAAAAPAADKLVFAKLSTSKGDIILELN